MAAEGTSTRRGFLAAGLAAAGGAAALSLEERALLAATASAPPARAAEPADAAKSAQPGPLPAAGRAAPAPFPCGKLGDRTVSRIICGGNLVSGFAHSRDLIYVSAMLKQYFTDEKVLETLRLCEEAGINTVIWREDARVARLLNEYWNKQGGKVQWIAQAYPSDSGPQTSIQRAADAGAVGCYIQGGIGDRWAREDRLDCFEHALEAMRKAGLIAGVGGHGLDVSRKVEKAGLKFDFHMKTLHKSDYWSYTKETVKDNSWCSEPEETIAFMRNVETPWIAFKVLAAGAIHPRQGFRYAFEGGADFACVGMFDFQLREDADVARALLAGNLKRARPWRA
ncbi:MAG: hypothetical protein FJ288_13700 [Planctomycetes bacterium]|nr:hypothetical protein [Planctomycetota bacterium]